MPDEPIDDNVVKLDPDKKAPWLKHKRRRHRCAHQRVTIYEESRMVECDTCGAILDPVTVLVNMAHGARSLYYSEAAIVAASKRLSEMSKEEKRVKARLKTARARLKETERESK